MGVYRYVLVYVGLESWYVLVSMVIIVWCGVGVDVGVYRSVLAWVLVWVLVWVFV